SILDPLDLIFEHELAFFEPRQLQRVSRVLSQGDNGAVQGAMLFTQFHQPGFERALFRRVVDVETVSVRAHACRESACEERAKKAPAAGAKPLSAHAVKRAFAHANRPKKGNLGSS